MKRIIPLFLAMCLVLGGCAVQEKPVQESVNSTKATSLPTEESTFPTEETEETLTENSAYQVYGVEDPTANRLTLAVLLNEPFETEEFIECNGRVYRIVDVTKNTKAEEKIVEKNIFPFGKLKRRDAIMPNILPSPHCEKPYRCWYYDFCHKTQKNALDGNSNLVK